MLSLIENELKRIESKILEQSCGEGAFLQEIIKTKFLILEKKYSKSQNEFDKNLIILISSLYGIDIQEDNVKNCINNLWNVTKKLYLKKFKNLSAKLEKSILFLFKKNILFGDSLKMKTLKGDSLIFSEWSAINNIYVSRRDFFYENLINIKNENVFIPKEIKIYEPVKFLDIGDYYE